MDCKCGCETFAEHIKGIQFQGWGAADTRTYEKNLTQDMRAFERLRKDGIRPGKFRGAANIERSAEIPQEVKMGMIMPKDLKQALKQGDGEIIGL